MLTRFGVFLTPPWATPGAIRDVTPSGAHPSFYDVIPDGPQSRAGIQRGTSRKPLDPRFALRAPEDDSRK